jgi:hypothetical protein
MVLLSRFRLQAEIYDGRNVFENTAKASFSSGIRMAGCIYSGHKIKNDTLEILLADNAAAVGAKVLVMDKGLPVRSMNIYDSVIIELDAAAKLNEG